MNNGILVSVVCLSYNAKNYIEECVLGVLNQETSFGVEMLIHDDASNDGTQDVLYSYAVKYPNIVKPYIQKHNQFSLGKGFVGMQINHSRAKGKYIAICEGDDYWCDSHKLQKQIDYMEAHPDCMMTFHRAKCKWEGEESERFTYDMEACEDRDYSIDELFENWIVPCASMVYRREVADYPIKHREFFFSGDDVLYYSAAEMGNVHGFSDVMSVYRVHVDSVSRNKENEIKRLMVYPKHYINVYKNFPHINRCKVRRRIAEYLHHKMNVDHSFWNNMCDMICMFFWDWRYAIKDLKQRFCWYFIPAIKQRLHIA